MPSSPLLAEWKINLCSLHAWPSGFHITFRGRSSTKKSSHPLISFEHVQCLDNYRRTNAIEFIRDFFSFLAMESVLISFMETSWNDYRQSTSSACIHCVRSLLTYCSPTAPLSTP